MQNENQVTQMEASKLRPRQSGKFLYKIGDVAYKELSISSYVTAPVTVWISGGLLLLSCVLYVTAFVTTGWGVVKEAVTDRVIEVGLWHSCVQNRGSCQRIDSLTGTYMFCQSLACFSLIGLLLSVLVLTLCCVSHHMRRKPSIQLSLFLLRPITAIFLLLTFAIYSGTWNKPNYTAPTYVTNLSYSYSLTIASFTFELLSSILMALEWHRWHQLMKNQDANEQLSESREHVLQNHASGFDPLNEEPSIQSNTKSPFELFQQFTGENSGVSSEKNIESQNCNEAGNDKSQYDISDRNRLKKSQQYPEHRNRPYTSYDRDIHEELGDLERQRPYGGGSYYNEGFNHDDSRQVPMPNPSRSLHPHTHYLGTTRNDKSMTGRNPVLSEPTVRNVNTVSAAVEVYDAPKSQPSVKPKASRKPKAPNVPSAGSLHSYENIPDGQPSGVQNRRTKEDTNYNRNHSRRDYNQHNHPVPEIGRNLIQSQYHTQNHKTHQQNMAQTPEHSHHSNTPLSSDMNRRPVKNTSV